MRKVGYALLFAVVDIFPVSLYGRSLRERTGALWHSLKGSISTILNVFTVFILTLTVALVAAIYMGATGWMEDNINKNRLARRITFSKTSAASSHHESGDSSVDSGLFGPDDMKHLRYSFASESGGKFSITGAWGWNDVQFWFRTGAGKKDARGYTSGRTVVPGDPLLTILDLVTNKEKAKTGDFFTKDDEGEIIVTKKLLAQLNISVEELAAQKGRIAIFYEPALGTRNASDVETQNFEWLQVLAVCESLPYGDYLITDSFHRDYRKGTWNPTPRFPSVYFGPMPRGPDLAAALEGCREFLEHQRATGSYSNRSDGLTWLTINRSPDQAWSLDEWKTQMQEGILRRLQNAKIDVSAIKMETGNSLNPSPTSEPFKGHLNASIDVVSVEEVPAAVDALSMAGYKVKESVRGEAMLLMQISSFGSAVFYAVIFVVSVLSAISIGLSFYQAVQRKTSEIAIFKAFGAGNGMVMFIYIVEALLIWAIASALGFVLVSWVVKYANAQLLQITHSAATDADGNPVSIVRLSSQIYIFTAAGSLILCCAATLSGAIEAVRLQPARALKAQG